ncbi:phosphopantetheine-binding protein [Actinosynnema sp.]|uniref:phosphopantetheine-binding protein n=1 Tax=Actinosynnema sp. TaxID=1872144 RepID=UPI003F862A4C
MWDQRFEEILRKHLPFAEPGDELAEDADLRDLGLDSLAMVDLLADLEKGFAVRFRDDALKAETFRTPSTLWAARSGLLEPSA